LNVFLLFKSRDGVVDKETLLRSAKVLIVVGFTCKNNRFLFSP